MRNDERSTNPRNPNGRAGIASDSGFRILTLLRHSSFGFRHQPTRSAREESMTGEIARAQEGFVRLNLVPVVADGLDRAAFLGLFALGILLRRLRLFVNKGIAAVVVAFEVVGRGFATEV